MIDGYAQSYAIAKAIGRMPTERLKREPHAFYDHELIEAYADEYRRLPCVEVVGELGHGVLTLRTKRGSFVLSVDLSQPGLELIPDVATNAFARAGIRVDDGQVRALVGEVQEAKS